MKLSLVRTTTTPDAILGTISIDGVFECVTLENRDLCIPLGNYTVGIYNSSHAGHLLPILQNVPDRDFVEIHCGNVSPDCKGCILVGTADTPDSVLNSHVAFAHLFPQIQSAINSGETVSITIA